MLSKYWLYSIVVLTITGCSSINPQHEKKGILGDVASRPVTSVTHEQLQELPPPAGKITSAVYGFRDLTGQNKPAPASGFSSAVTQGAENILVKALLDSGWFKPVERSGLQNLLTERNLWQQTLSGRSSGAVSLPALPPASIIIEGGIISYDFNIRTGGVGAKYLGIGGSENYREDVLTINLRVVNARDGAILHSITSRKNIFSRSVNTGIFGFVDFDQILELESGYAYNEPVQLGVVEAIESAVIDLIVEGVVAGTWRLENPAEIEHPSFERYLSTRDMQIFKEAQASASLESTSNSKTTDTQFAGDVVEEIGRATVNTKQVEIDTTGSEYPAPLTLPATDNNTPSILPVESNPLPESSEITPDPKPQSTLEPNQSVKSRIARTVVDKKTAATKPVAKPAKPPSEKPTTNTTSDSVNDRPAGAGQKLPVIPASQVSAVDQQSSTVSSTNSIEQEEKTPKPSALRPYYAAGPKSKFEDSAEAGSQQPSVTQEPGRTVESVTISVGAFSQRDDAEQVHKNLLEKIDSFNVNLAVDKQQSLYSIEIGPIASQDGVDDVVSILRELKVKQVRVIQNFKR